MARIRQIIRHTARNKNAKYGIRNEKHAYTKKNKDRETKYAYTKKVLVNGKYRYYYT